MAEWFKAPVLKTGEGASLPWVRIPPRPPVTVPPTVPDFAISRAPSAFLAMCISQDSHTSPETRQWRADAPTSHAVATRQAV